MADFSTASSICSFISHRREPQTSLLVLIARRMEPEHFRQFVSKATRPSSRMAFGYLRPVLPVPSKGRLSARLPDILYRKPSATPLSIKLATQSISEPIKHCKDDYLRLPR